MNSKAAGAGISLPSGSNDTSEPDEDSRNATRCRSIVVPLERFQNPHQYSERAVHQRNADTPQKKIKVVQLKLTLHELMQLVKDIKSGNIGAKTFTWFTDAEKEESEKNLGIKSKILRKFYDRSDQLRCVGGSGSFLHLKEDNGMMDDTCGSSHSSLQVKKCGVAHSKKMQEVDKGEKYDSGVAVIENGDSMNCCVATTEDKRENEVSNTVSASIASEVKVFSADVEECRSFETSTESTDNSNESKLEQTGLVLERKVSSESLSSSSNILESSLEIDSTKSSSEDDDDGDDYDWISVEDDSGTGELYETGMLPPAYPWKALGVVSPSSSGNSNFFCGWEEKDGDVDPDCDYIKSEKTERLISEGKRRPVETCGMFGVSKMLNSGCLDSAIMRFQIDESAARYDAYVDKLLTSFLHDRGFQWNPPKENLKREVEELSEVTPPKPNMQCMSCKKYEYAGGLSEPAIRSFICCNCVEFDQQSIFLDVGTTTSLLEERKPKLEITAATNPKVLMRTKRRRK